MKLITSDNNQCIAAAFAMVFDIRLDTMLYLLGHNGLQVVCNKEPPYCYRGFHPAEFVSLALTRGYSVSMIERQPMMIHGEVSVDHSILLGKDLWEYKFYKSFDVASGVVLGSLDSGGKLLGHAVAWDAEARKILDPRGMVTTLTDTLGFEPRQLFLIQRVCSHEGRESLPQ